jgi:hypothetical protein
MAWLETGLEAGLRVETEGGLWSKLDKKCDAGSRTECWVLGAGCSALRWEGCGVCRSGPVLLRVHQSVSYGSVPPASESVRRLGTHCASVRRPGSVRAVSVNPSPGPVLARFPPARLPFLISTNHRLPPAPGIVADAARQRRFVHFMSFR